MHVVDHDRRRVAGEEGCGVQLGSRGFAGERERGVTMSRKGRLGKQGFAVGFWTSYYEAALVSESLVFERPTIAFDQNGICHRFNRMICTPRSARFWAI
jgi:hypothetical protein